MVQAIENEDEAFLIKFPGVGKKTARQMILDLKGKLPNILPDYFPDLFNPDEQEEGVPKQEEFEEAILALLALGYSERGSQKDFSTAKNGKSHNRSVYKKRITVAS